ncbi:hypothetical protein SDC9_108136 [bioreactor metagenome]|uniref:Uncharacterized protein n=1 Tax=bioreactor metagenome TaxID=1076179 RepID=A0A645B8A1_9ZZZZ
MGVFFSFSKANRMCSESVSALFVSLASNMLIFNVFSVLLLMTNSRVPSYGS